MLKNVALILSIAAITLYSCDPAATFNKPQPDAVKAQSAFPERLWGKYLSTDQASVVTVTGQLIIDHLEFDLKVHKDSLGAAYKVIGDSLVNTDGTKQRASLKGDTIVIHANSIDTLFNISADNVLKKFKGYYFLNTRYDSSSWIVRKLSLKKGVLTIASIEEEADIEKLKEITETTADTLSTPINLKRRQFKTFVRRGGFAEEESFTRMAEK